MILLLENKINRLGDRKFKNKIEVVRGDTNCNTCLDSFLDDSSIFDKYSTLIIHESIYIENKRESLFLSLEDYCRKNKKNLVIFSGNNSQSSWSEDKKILRLSPNILYANLNAFAEEKDLLILAYGKNASLNLMLNVLERLHLYVAECTESPLFDDFEADIELLKLKVVLTEDEYEQLFNTMADYKNYIDTNQISILANNLKNLIQEKANA